MNTTSTRKRTHLKPDQVDILQASFNCNALPDSSVRTKLARDLGVTERTIQIWFQNRRAKMRKSESLQQSKPDWSDPTTITRHPTPPRYQATFRTMMTPERFEELKQDGQQIRKRPRSSSKPEPKSLQLIESMQNRSMSEGVSNQVLFPTTTTTTTAATVSIQPTPIQMVHFPVHVLRIGSWTRFAHASPQTDQRSWDLVCHASTSDREFIWKVQAEGHHFRMQVKFDTIQQLRLSQQVQLETGELIGQLEVETSLPVAFSMWRFGKDNQWTRCGDFTEDKQASLNPHHLLQGNHEMFKQALLNLISLAPELASKISVLPALDICRDFTISPSATPEPSSLFANYTMPSYIIPTPVPQQQQQQQQHIHHHHQFSKPNPSMSHLMLQAPFFYPPNTISNDGNEELYQMMQQQQMMYSSAVLM